MHGAATKPISIERYAAPQAGRWDEFVRNARNRHFLFYRGYMDYHADRFHDHSLLFWRDTRLLAVLPASERDRVLTSHGGLTFGGIVAAPRMTAATMLEIVAGLRNYLRDHELRHLIYKAMPHVYHSSPNEEDLYALFIAEAPLIRRDLSSAIDLSHRLPLAKGRKWSTKKASRGGIEVAASDDFAGFMDIVAWQLRERYGLKPTHTADEISLLAQRFQDNIKLIAAYYEGRMVAGAVMYESDVVMHAQYLAATEDGRALEALNAVIDHLLNQRYADLPLIFDFGISTENDGRYLNLSLTSNKESYGARGIVYDTYRLDAAGRE